MASQLSPQTLQQLRQQIDAAIVMPLPAAPAAQPAPPGAPVDFCKIWPTAKPILQGAAVFIALLGPAAAAALNALLSVGDQVYNATCNKN